jgi:hypothetical protein
MMKMVVKDNFTEQVSSAGFFVGRFYSVEFGVDGIESPYQFKLWNGYSGVNFLLVKESSGIAGRLHIGDIFNVKHHSIDSNSPSEFIDTEITDITREDEGRFKGYYLVELSLLN